MKLNLHILKEDLKDWKFDGTIMDNPTEMNCAYPLLSHSFPKYLQKDVVYVMNSVILPESPVFPLNISILCIGKPPQNWLDMTCNLLYTEEDISQADLINAITQRFFYYTEWENDLQEILNKKQPFQKLVDRTQKMISNPIAVISASFRIISTSTPTTFLESPLYKHYCENFLLNTGAVLNADDIEMLIADKEYLLASDTTEPTIYQGIPFGFRTLYYNVFIEGAYISRICFDEILVPLSNKDISLILMFGSYIEKGFSNDKISMFILPKELGEILDGLLSHHLLPEKKICSFLRNNKWNIFDTYVCIVLKHKSAVGNEVLEPLAIRLSKTLMNDCYIIKDQTIVCIYNISQLQKSRNQLFTTILPFLRDNLLSAGISTPYQDFKNLYYYYNQAIIAMQIGEKKEPTKWYFRFEEYQLDYMIQKCTEKILPEILIPTGLKTLMLYDKQKQTDFTKTLQVYLDCDRNIAETIRILFMHRNTFLYRLERIQAIINMDLDNTNNRLILQLAFRILDASSIKSS